MFFSLRRHCIIVVVVEKVGCIPNDLASVLYLHGCLFTVHDFLLFEEESTLGEHGQTKDGDRKRDFLIARNGSAQDGAASMALNVHAAQAVAFGTDTNHTEGNEQWRTGLAAELNIAATATGLFATSVAKLSRVNKYATKVRRQCQFLRARFDHFSLFPSPFFKEQSEVVVS